MCLRVSLRDAAVLHARMCTLFYTQPSKFPAPCFAADGVAQGLGDKSRWLTLDSLQLHSSPAFSAALGRNTPAPTSCSLLPLRPICSMQAWAAAVPFSATCYHSAANQADRLPRHVEQSKMPDVSLQECSHRQTHRVDWHGVQQHSFFSGHSALSSITTQGSGHRNLYTASTAWQARQRHGSATSTQAQPVPSIDSDSDGDGEGDDWTDSDGEAGQSAAADEAERVKQAPPLPTPIPEVLPPEVSYFRHIETQAIIWYVVIHMVTGHVDR